MITLELFEMKLMRTLKWLIAILMMQMKGRTSLMRNHEALSLGRSYPDNVLVKKHETKKGPFPLHYLILLALGRCKTSFSFLIKKMLTKLKCVNG